jgi:hypothetical protein
MLNCKDASQLISQSLEQPLTMRERFALNLHLLICKYCKRFSQQLHTIGVALKLTTRVIEQDETIKLPSETRKRLMRSIESNQN